MDQKVGMVNLVFSSGKLFLLCICWRHQSGLGFRCCHLHADENYCGWRIFCAIGEVITSYICIVVSRWSSFASPSVLSVCLYHWLCVRNLYLFNESLEPSSKRPPTRSVRHNSSVVASVISSCTASVALTALIRHVCCEPFKWGQLQLGCLRWHRTSSILFVYHSFSCEVQSVLLWQSQDFGTLDCLRVITLFVYIWPTPTVEYTCYT